MASTPNYASAPRIGVVNVSTANTNRDGTGTIADILTGVAAGTRIERIRLKATANPADSIVTIYIHNGTSYFLFDEFDLGDPAAASNTVEAGVWERPYQDLILPSASFKLAAAITVALTSGVIVAWAFGADLT